MKRENVLGMCAVWKKKRGETEGILSQSTGSIRGGGNSGRGDLRVRIAILLRWRLLRELALSKTNEACVLPKKGGEIMQQTF